MSKRPLGHGNLRNMGNFKAVAADYEYYLTLSDEGQLYCLSDRQVYVLQVQLTYVGWLTRWYNTDDITQTTVGYIQSDLMEALMSCVDVSVLVNQGKLTLTNSVQNQQIQSAGLRKIYEDRYDGDPTSINPDAPTTDFGATGDRFDALCAALTAFVYQFAKAQAEAVIAADITAFALLAGVAILLIPGLNLFFIAGAALALAAGGGIIGVTTAVAVAALTDTTALDAVICYMRDTLKAQSVTEAHWSACLDSYPFTVGSHAAIICDFIKPTLTTNYLPVLDMLGQAYSGTINGDPLPECPCHPWEWEHIFDFTLDDGGFSIWGGPFAGTPGVWHSGVGWVSGFATAGGFAYQMVQIQRAFDPTTITSAEVTYTMTNGINGGLTRLLDTSAGTLASSTDIPPDGPGTFSGSGTEAGATYIGLRVQAGNQAGSSDPGGTCTVTRLVVRGDGVDPFI